MKAADGEVNKHKNEGEEGEDEDDDAYEIAYIDNDDIIDSCPFTGNGSESLSANDEEDGQTNGGRSAEFIRTVRMKPSVTPRGRTCSLPDGGRVCEEGRAAPLRARAQIAAAARGCFHSVLKRVARAGR